MKFIIITIALAAAPLLAATGEAGHIAMGSKSGVVHSQGRGTEERYSERDSEGKRTGKDLLSEENNARKKGATLPEKKPRLKYRDEPTCSC